MKKILIIYEHIGDHADFFTMEFDEKDPQGQEDLEASVKFLRVANYYYQNIDHSEEAQGEEIDAALNTLDELIYGQDGMKKSTDWPDWFKKLEPNQIIECHPDYIFHTGIY